MELYSRRAVLSLRERDMRAETEAEKLSPAIKKRRVEIGQLQGKISSVEENPSRPSVRASE